MRRFSIAHPLSTRATLALGALAAAVSIAVAAISLSGSAPDDRAFAIALALGVGRLLGGRGAGSTPTSGTPDTD